MAARLAAWTAAAGTFSGVPGRARVAVALATTVAGAVGAAAPAAGATGAAAAPAAGAKGDKAADKGGDKKK